MGASMDDSVLGDVKTVPVVVGYCIASSLLSIVNKYAFAKFPYPSVVTLAQYATCALTVNLLGRFKVLKHDALDREKLIRFLPPAIVFFLAVFTNANLLERANVETFIVFRSSTPILVAISDSIFRNEPLPSPYTFSSLLVILGGAVGYVVTDSQFNVAAYGWAFAYLIIITTEMVYIRHVVTTFDFTVWGLVYYNNIISLLLAPIGVILDGELLSSSFSSSLDMADNLPPWLSVEALAPVVLSCAFGVAISFFGFSCRKAISATAFTVLGVVNKLLTVVVNLVIWDRHASHSGTAFLLMCIAGGVLYQQSTSASTATSSSTQSLESEATEAGMTDQKSSAIAVEGILMDEEAPPIPQKESIN